MLLTDNQIAARAADGMITPFAPQQVRRINDTPIISFGLSSAGYDIRLSPDGMKTFAAGTVDPKNFDASLLMDIPLVQGEHGAYYLLPGHSVALATSVEHFEMPFDVTGILLCKSTYIRAGLLIPTTVFEAGWRGIPTLELVNVNHSPVRVYANEGIGQILFFAGDEPPAITYATRAGGPGKYQNQRGIVPPRV